jgi:phage tail-like protein
MAEPKPKKSRVDPYRNFKFRVTFNGRAVAGASEASGLDTSAAAPAVSRSAMARRATKRGVPKMRLTLGRAVTHDAEFEAWVASGGTGELVIEQLDEAGRVASAYRLTGAKVTAFQALPDLDANANAVAIEVLTIDATGWEQITPPVA